MWVALECEDKTLAGRIGNIRPENGFAEYTCIHHQCLTAALFDSSFEERELLPFRLKRPVR